MNVANLAYLTTTPLAEGAPPPPAGDGMGNFLQMLSGGPGLMMLLVLVLYIFIFTGKRKDAKAKKERLSAIKRGDRVQTIGGILGKVVDVDEKKIQLKVDESSNTKIWFSRDAVHTVLGEEKAATATAAATPAKS